MPSSLKEVQIKKCRSLRQSSNSYPKTDTPKIVLRSTSRPGKCGRLSNQFDSTSEEQELRSSPVIDDRSNSASPTRRQPNPTGMMAFRGFFGQSMGNDERILEWPPPEPRPVRARPVMPNFGGLLGPRTTPFHNPNVWFFGPTANVQQVVFEDGPEIITEEDDDDDFVTEEPPPLLHAQSSGLHRTGSDISIDSGHLGGSELSSDSIPLRDSAVLMSMNGLRAYEPFVDTNNRSRDNSVAAGTGAVTGSRIDTIGVHSAGVPRVSTIPETEEMRATVQVHQGAIQPPPRPVVFIVMDTNDMGRDQDEPDFPTEQFQFALQQLLNHLNSLSDDAL